jgi:xylan 1,4-beta-xylosidase
MKMIFLSLCYLFCVSLSAQILVLPGDFPDPSVTKIGDSYWATATTSNWAPAFPLLESKDLIHWQIKGHVFPKLPAWADYYFWAPEIAYEKNKVYVYYAAHKRDGNLCVAVASADKPEGPYKDHGTLMCEKVGSIDAFPIRDNNGKLYLVWKEDGNSVRESTPIWAIELNEERTKVIGEKKLLFRNTEPWESNLVEGVSMIRHGDYIYAFYAGAGCCGRECSYAMGIARANDVLGPWEKYDRNPLFNSNESFKCPGHGTPIEKDGGYFLLYHAYSASGDVYAGRQGVLKEFRFTDDGWVELMPDEERAIVPTKLYDEFTGNTLSPHWQWSVFQTLQPKLKNGKLELNAMPDKSGAFLGQKVYTADYQADITVFPAESSSAAGLAVVGDEKNLISATLSNGKLTVWQLINDVETKVMEKPISTRGNIYLRADVRNGKEITFSYSTDGKMFNKLNDNPIDGFYLPPWDRAVRVALIAKGKPNQKAVFDNFILDNK